ncbi:MAG: hypothetical protein HYV27_09640 [Candidatus Hydrogenedentes bacterium]|nr:hypothetical protein [Candidatus Hydrogenedentota bacterium]
MIRLKRWSRNAMLMLTLGAAAGAHAADSAAFEAGFAAVDITPSGSVPLWGYGKDERAENFSTGANDPLFAKALVFSAGATKAAIVGLDLGRAPYEPMLERLRAKLKAEAGIEHFLFVGSHTHHAPALELVRIPGRDQSVLEPAFAYYGELEAKLAAAILSADQARQPAKWGWASGPSNMSRNRHTTESPIPRDPELFVLRVERLDGKPIALMVNFAAHPTNHPPHLNKFSADFPGVMAKIVEKELGAPCMFLQGAAGDQQCDMNDALWDKEDFKDPMGEWLAKDVIALAPAIQTKAPERPALTGATERFSFPMRLDLKNPLVTAGMREAYGEELHASYSEKCAGGQLHPSMTVLLINHELALAGGSGEFFSALSLRLKNAIAGPKALLLGYCNGHDMYFPSARAMAQGGYGAEPGTAWIAQGGSEQMIDWAVGKIHAIIGP